VRTSSSTWSGARRVRGPLASGRLKNRSVELTSPQNFLAGFHKPKYALAAGQEVALTPGVSNFFRLRWAE
jgi:hypothetical protein